MYRLLYIYDIADLLVEIRRSLREQHTLGDPSNRHRNKDFTKLYSYAVLRGLLVQELYINLLPDKKIPHIHRDHHGIIAHCPWIAVRIHRQIVLPHHLFNEWVKLSIEHDSDMTLEYDLRPRDYSTFFWE